ncbi:MAG: DegV family protein [Lachnospiraceae bacterium]|nr:DegV family protein [Lachnospiraceae bacterium]
MGIKIISDSTCDLSKELIEQYNISIIPLCIVMGDKSYYDGLEVTPDEIYKWADANKTTPKTAAASFDFAGDVLKPHMEAGDDIIFIGIGEKLSTTCNVLRLLGKDAEYDKLHVIDSANLSTGIGLQILYAAKLIEEGKSAKEIVELIEARRDKVRASFVVETLTYLARGGRCSAVTALLGNALSLKPEIVVEDGAMKVAKKYRGKQASVILKYAKDMEEALKTADPSCIFITHSGCEQEIVDSVKEYLESLNRFENIYTTRAGGVISSHCGPRTLGVLFYAN